MLKPNRWVLLGSGGLAAIVAVGACLMLLSTGPTFVHKPAAMLETFNTLVPSPPPAEPARMAMPDVSAPAVMEPAAPPEEGGAPATDAIPISVPQVAYSYTLGYRLPASAIAGAQQAHLDLCNRMGPRCQLVSMERGGNDDGATQASLKLRVATSLAQKVSAGFTQLVGKAGGRAVDTQISAEDVSKDLVDTGARIRQREILVSRLTEMLRGRAGRVSELVEAERSVAQAQEELDQAKGWMGELKGRVAYSDFTMHYTPVTAPVAAPTTRQGFLGQLSDAVAQSGAVIVNLVRGLILLVIFLGPWALIAGLLFWFARPVLIRWRSAALAPVNEDA